MSTVGFVGLGSMGAPIAGRLLPGNTVYGTNRTRAKADELIKQGLIWRDTPREVAAAAQVVFSMVTDDTALAAITDGPDGILGGLRPGSVPAAQTGTLSIMVGGPDADFHTVEPLLNHLGSSITHAGANGQGLLLKLAINISLATQMLAFSEGVLLAERGGIDPQLAIQAMITSPIGSPMLRTRAPLVLDLPEQAWFDVQLMHKDIRLALQAAHQSGVLLPAASAADTALSRAEEIGYGHRDIAGLYQVLDRTPAPADAA